MPVLLKTVIISATFGAVSAASQQPITELSSAKVPNLVTNRKLEKMSMDPNQNYYDQLMKKYYELKELEQYWNP